MTCPYTNCPIPENNNYYLAQTVYMFISAVALVNFPVKIDSFSIILLIFPSILDMMFTKLVPEGLNWFKRCLLVIDFALILLSVLGQTSLISYTGNGFLIPDGAVFFPGVQILNIKIIAAILIANFIPPLLFYFGCPCKKNLKHIAEAEATVP